ncbi:MAG: hypothetical protein OES57_04455 [Acidimicrobiia bacterium]|nr:hypothetical protein [Acidimicrobiia bacterium]
MTSRRTAAVAITFVAIAIVLSLSDRAPGLLRQLTDAGVAVWRRIEIAFAIDVDRDAIPWTSDEIAHLMLWGGGMLILGLVLRTRVRPDRLAVALFASSLALEVLQALVTARRSLSLADSAANALGIMVGLSLVVAAGLLWPVRSPTQP